MKVIFCFDKICNLELRLHRAGKSEPVILESIRVAWSKFFGGGVALIILLYKSTLIVYVANTTIL